ncbi:uncharacterized protein LOC121406281 [Lytechinus variegatus]|uniref:uncharacterized protein LOC121406281 n=1 Tax=Lytechinus variegatus TaxID=7654 RepID=UPI001BB23741|nr:uncharacterized protein LOC121406281 [Lytechinus variegatus]
MGRHSCREATSDDIAKVYDLLNEYVIEQELEDEFMNSKPAFSEHYKRGLFTPIIAEVTNDGENEKDIIGCAFISFPFNYVIGITGFIHCCYLKPSYRDLGLQQMLLKLATKVSIEKGSHGLLAAVCGRDYIFNSAFESEGATNLNTSMAKGAGSDFWIMPNPSATPEFLSDDYVIREGAVQDSEGVYDLCQELVKLENIEDIRTPSFTKEEFIRKGGGDSPLYGTVVLEHQRRIGDNESDVIHDIVGCILYTKMYHALKGDTYWLQGLYICPEHKGKGLGKPLVRASLEVCKKRHGDGFIFIILRNNHISQSLFKSLQGVNMTKSKHNMQSYLLLYM